jgi:cell division protein FtsI/penicillin-binding protein 2
VVQPTSAVPCPGSLVVGGKTFINADRFQLGTVSLRRAFARSCNTTFTSLATTLPDGALTRTAAQFGVGVDWKLGVPSYDGAVPPPRDATENAADAIGQGTVLTSPLSMALVAATVQHGSVPTPTLISGERSAPPDPPAALDPALVTTLRDFSRAVVTEGTAAAVLGSAPGLVAGKTGTAEYGAARPPRSHSWFAGYRGDLAFAVFVFDGASSGTIATPVAESFLAGVPLS